MKISIGQFAGIRTKKNTAKRFDDNKNSNKQTPVAYKNNDFCANCNSVHFMGNGKSFTDYQKIHEFEKNLSPEARRVYDDARIIAKKANSSEVETWHIYFSLILELKNFIDLLDDGSTSLEKEARFKTPFALIDMVCPGEDLFSDDKQRAQIEEVVDNQIEILKEYFLKPELVKKKKAKITKPVLSKRALDDLMDATRYKKQDDSVFNDSGFLLAASLSQDKQLASLFGKFGLDLQKSVMLDNSFVRGKNHIKFYDKKADVIWKNISHKNNVLVINSKENMLSYSYLLNSFINLINKPGLKYAGLDANNIEFVMLNDKAHFDFLTRLIKEIKNNKDNVGKTFVIMADFDTMLKNADKKIKLNTIKALDNSQDESINSPVLRFVISISPESFQANSSTDNAIGEMFSNYAQQSLPILNIADAKENLTDEAGMNFIKAKTGKEFSKEAINRAINVTSAKEGNFPEKTIEFLSTVAKYFIEEEKITKTHIDSYVNDTKHLSEAVNLEDKDIIFDTQKNLNSIKGMPMTKAEANSIVMQIKDGSIGTKGFVIYHNDGSANGGGRRHTAESIAGETQIPMVIMNAKEFALKDIDMLSREPGLAEAKIKKMILSAKTQAEANKLNTVMLFIENFDNFASNPLFGISSVYEQKAFSQLLSEMDNIRKEGKINLLVIGSMNMPNTLDDNIKKPYKFLNSIVVYQPKDAQQRKEVLEYYIEKQKIKIKGENQAQKDIVVKNISESTLGFSVVELMYLLETAKIVAKERGHEEIDASDFTESFLQTITGRPNTAYMSDFNKKIVAAHEVGHAITLKVMQEVAQKQKIPWQMPDEIDFITLDPRSNFGGAMFHKFSENRQISFEKVISDIVCSYGGYSAENLLFNMQGSWGITSDIKTIEREAQIAVMDMGMGSKTGVRHILRNSLGEPNVSESKKRIIEEDIDRIVNCGKKISDKIIFAYRGFVEEFYQKYYSKVATGECIISSDEFLTMLKEWKSKQSSHTKEQLRKLEDDIILEITECKIGF